MTNRIKEPIALNDSCYSLLALNESSCMGRQALTGGKDFTCVKYIENGSKILTGCSDGLIRIYESGTLQLTKVLGTANDTDNQSTIPVTDITSVPPRDEAYLNYFMATYANGYVKLWNAQTGDVATTLDEQRQTLGISFSPILPNFVTVGDDSVIYLYDEKTMSVSQTLKSSETMGKVDGHTSRVFCAEFHPKSANDLVTGGWDNTVQFWDVRKPNSTRFITGPHICGRGIHFKPVTGRELITASYSKETPLQKWDYSTGKLLFNYEADLFKSMLYCGMWIDSDHVGTGGADPSLFRIINSTSNNTIGYFRTQQTGIYSMDCKEHKEIAENHSESILPAASTVQSSPQPKHKIKGITIVRNVICAGRYIIELDATLNV
ncbi:WD repeat-containing protein 18-like [Lycorma delicatula]|uniref:WD repeat-containing protein 18-like n=1 Tax=Lycorma delicatula TaxID=130591 RepID=UPI003F515960